MGGFRLLVLRAAHRIGAETSAGSRARAKAGVVAVAWAEAGLPPELGLGLGLGLKLGLASRLYMGLKMELRPGS